MSKIKKKIILILAFCLIFIGSLNWALPICYSASIDFMGLKNALTGERTAAKDSNKSSYYQYWEVSFQSKSGYKDSSITLGPYKVIFLDDGSKLIKSNRATLEGDGSLCKFPQCNHHSEKCPFWISPEVQRIKITDYGNHVYLVLEGVNTHTYLEFLIDHEDNFKVYYAKKACKED